MKEKFTIIMIIIIFIISLVIINIVLKNQIEKENNEENEIINNDKNEEENEMGILNKNDEKVIDVTSNNFENEVLKSEKVVLIDFYADWCMPCTLLSPRVEEIAQEREDIKVVRVNVDNEQVLSNKYEIMSIPTLVLIKDGKELNRIVGLVDKEEITYMIDN